MKTNFEKLGFLAAAICGLAVFLMVGAAEAQDNPPFECDNNFGECGTPEQSGGGCGCGGGSILINNTDLGDTYQFADDYDDDGTEDPMDNCPFVNNRDQAEGDGDGVGNACDNCPDTGNEDQSDVDGDGFGDVCDDDIDDDGALNAGDNCPSNPNPSQLDTDSDGLGDACDDDIDNDGVDNLEDNCPKIANANQDPEDEARFGAECDDDDDGDGIRNTVDNCPTKPNEDQKDVDGDGKGDACDPDIDGDGINNNAPDNCVEEPNEDQMDVDRDGVGDSCDSHKCYVVDDSENCLDPEQAFMVYTPDHPSAAVGSEIKLKLFANRESQPMRYTWRIEKAPKGSSASVKNAVGAVSESSPYEYRYLSSKAVTFVPDEPGTYTVQVTAELVWKDQLYPEASRSQATAIIEAGGDSSSAGGCSVTSVGSSPVPASHLLPLLLLAIGLVLRRRS